MIFKPQNFRRRGKDSNPPTIREAGTLIIVKASGETAYARTKGDKDHVVSHFDEKRDLLLWAWIGERYTDIFQLTKDDLVTHGGFQLTKDDLVKRASGLGFRGVLHIAAGDARVKDQVARASAATRIEREEGGMEQRAFFDVLEYWAGPMT